MYAPSVEDSGLEALLQAVVSQARRYPFTLSKERSNLKVTDDQLRIAPGYAMEPIN